ncbi:MAG: hypothetical protein IJX72_06465, partial [Clostridia bacterium]|nr:hypothetical protein [Clostridia bacterium]
IGSHPNCPQKTKQSRKIDSVCFWWRQLESEPSLASLGVQAALRNLRVLQSGEYLLAGSLRIGSHPNCPQKTKQSRKIDSVCFWWRQLESNQ